jgi:hypothetical protein
LIRSFNGQKDENDKYENQAAHEAVVLIGNMKLLGTGYNIQEANNVCIFDLPWTPDQRDQTIGRCYRSGQNRVVHVKSFVAPGNGIEGKIYHAFIMHKEVTDLSFTITSGQAESAALLQEKKAHRERLAEEERLALEKDLTRGNNPIIID